MAKIDYIVMAVYLAGILSVGFMLSRKVKSSGDLFAAGGRSPWWASGLSAFMTMFSAGTFVVWGGIAYEQGLVAVSINLCYGVAALAAGYFLAGRWKNLGIDSPAEYVSLRFGKPALHLYTWTMLLFRMVGVAVALYALATIMVALMPLGEGVPFRDPVTGNLALHWAVFLFGLVVVVYTMVGGLWAVLMTDVLQFIVLTLSVLFVSSLLLLRAGDAGASLQQIPENFLKPTSGEYGMLFLAGWAAIHFFMIGAEWAFVQRYLCVENERAAKKATYLFAALYLVSPVLWFLPPMVFRVIEPGLDKEQAYILACQSVLPAGMVGLMVAAMFSATASMVSSQLNVFAGVLTQDIYKRLLRPASKERELVLIGRIATALLGVALIGIAIMVPRMGGAERVIVALTSLIVTPLLAPSVWGLLRKNTSLSHLFVTVTICFTAGLTTYCVKNELITVPAGFLSEWANWVRTYPQSTDVLVGVVLPVALLLVLDLSTFRRTNPGWTRLASHEPEPIDRAGTHPGRMPAYIVAGGTGACGVMMLGILPFNREGHGMLILFSAVMLGLAATILFLVRRTQEQDKT